MSVDVQEKELFADAKKMLKAIKNRDAAYYKELETCAQTVDHTLTARQYMAGYCELHALAIDAEGVGDLAHAYACRSMALVALIHFVRVVKRKSN